MSADDPFDVEELLEAPYKKQVIFLTMLLHVHVIPDKSITSVAIYSWLYLFVKAGLVVDCAQC